MTDLDFGCAVQARHVLVDQGLRETILKECDTITPELELKWDFVESDKGQLNLAPAQQLAQIVTDAGKKLHGHALVWHKSTPAWAIEAILDQREWSIVTNFFDAIMPPFSKAIDSWDVVNEPIETGHGEDGLRNSFLMRAFGADYIERAFVDARARASRADLYLNEFGLLDAQSYSSAKRAATLRLLERLVSRGVPIDGLGIQGHLDLKRGPIDQQGVSNFVQKVADLGLKIRISELDVREASPDIPQTNRDQEVANAVAALLDVVLPFDNLTGITCWGISDRYSWLPPLSITAGLNRGLPLDSDLRQKPMYWVLENALRQRKPSKSSDRV